ncbi:MAG: peptidoglycan editing factor PgeF [Gammaproteobacteria bacterium]|nr:peptidoglycan editing factor PgeF [Gammaproteobacteria bacterium]
MEYKAALIYPDWPAPSWVHAVSTTRQGGVSSGPFSSFNLAQHVGDSNDNVSLNRARLVGNVCLSQEPAWLTQVHGNRVLDVANIDSNGLTEADASYASKADQACVVMTADCLPILLCHRKKKIVAAVHAGWRGLVQGVVEATLSPFGDDRSQIIAWLGPGISNKAFEVGDDVCQAFATDKDKPSCFSAISETRWHADLYELVRLRLNRAGVDAIYGGEFCTYTDSERFFSYRRDGKTGRMASLIWLAD